jgi:hypothetical protein
MGSRAKELNFDPAAVRQHAVDNFSVETMVNKYTDLYRELRQDVESQAPEAKLPHRAIA